MKNNLTEAVIASQNAVVTIPQNQPPYLMPGINAIGGSMDLHKGHDRTERLYFVHCYDWDQLETLLVDPIKFFREDAQLTSDAPVSPVVALIRPMSREPDSREMTASKTLASLAFEASPGPFEAMGLEEEVTFSQFEDFIMDENKGWFLAEFANKTHVLNIYYIPPVEPAKNRFLDALTIPTICMFNANEKNGQVHFDLDNKDGRNMPEQRAAFIVDYLEDGGSRMLEGLNAHPNREFASLGSILNEDDSTTEENAVPDMRSFTVPKNGERNKSPELLVEGLSFIPLDENGNPLPTFVCLQGSAMVEGQAYVVDGGTLKVYTAPPPGP